MTVKRFTAAILFLCLAPLNAARAAEDLDAAFAILRKGAPIGYHVVDVARTEDGFTAHTRIEMKVKFGPLPLFRYRHETREEWAGGELVSLESVTNDNGQRSWVKAKRRNGVLEIESPVYNGPAPEGVMTPSYWNKAVVDASMLLNSQNGELIEVDVAALGKTRAPDNRLADQYRMVGTLALDLWYDGDRWVGSHFVIDGEELTYKPMQKSEHGVVLARLD